MKNKLNYMYVYNSNGKIKSYYTNNSEWKQVYDLLNKKEGKKVKLIERRWIGDDSM